MALTNVQINQPSFGTLFKMSFFIGRLAWVLIDFFILLLAIIAPSSLTTNGESATMILDSVKGFFLSLTLGAISSALKSTAGAGLMGLLAKSLALALLMLKKKPGLEPGLIT